MHPFVALMRTYCIDYTNSHDQGLYDQIMEPDYVVHINGMHLERSTTYADAVRGIFAAAPGLGLVVHELVLNGDRLAMHFSEHGAMPTRSGPRLACWRGIGLYRWNGRRLTENWVEQDYLAMQAQLDDGVPHPLSPPHLDPWTTTEPRPADPDAEACVREWLAAGDLSAAEHHEIDDSRTGASAAPLVTAEEVRVDDLFSAGDDVAFHVTVRGAYRGGLGAGVDDRIGAPARIQASGIARVGRGRVRTVRAVTTRSQLLADLQSTEAST